MLPRLKRRGEFVRAAKSGIHGSAGGMAVQAYLRRDGEGPADGIRVGFTTSKKVGNAVIRNRVRRRLRVVADTLLTESGKPGHDYVLVGRTAAKDRDFQDLLRDLRSALKQIERRAAKRDARQRQAAKPERQAPEAEQAPEAKQASQGLQAPESGQA